VDPLTNRGGPAVTGGKLVLVVDDNAVNRTLLVQMLEVLEIPSRSAADGREALDLLRTHDYAAVLMDVTMPLLDGRTATRMLRAEETGRRTPVIAVTAATSDEDRRLCQAAGMDGFLPKPVSLVDLSDALSAYVTLPRPAVRDEVSTLDHGRLRSLQDDLGDASVVREVVDIYLEELPLRMSAIDSALSCEDRDTLKVAAHSLKSSSAMLGATAISQRCAALEAAALSADLAQLTAAATAVAELREGTEAAFRRWLAV